MANYPKELTDLLAEYLTDGIISAKERQVLLKKAEQLGVDTAEFDLYIDAQQQKVDQAVDAAAAKKRGKSCPFCGGTLPQLADKCPHCGETVTPEASAELEEIFDHLEEALIDFKSGKDIAKNKAVVERYVRKAKMYYENNPKVQKLLAEVQSESLAAEDNALAIAKKEGIAKLISNKWIWCVIEAIVACIVYMYYSFQYNYWDEKLQLVGGHYGHEFVMKQSAGSGKTWTIILAILIIGITGYIANKSQKNNS